MRLLLLAALTFTPATVLAQSSIPYAIVFDSYMTPAAGAQGLLTVQHLLASAEDRWLPLKIGAERSRPSLAVGILYRSGKFFALDLPQDHFLLVVAHEVFGHGARFRELGDGHIRYGFDAPIPYGSGDAFTRFNGLFPVSPLAQMNISAAGIEAQHALADAIAERAVARGRLHYREAWLYFESRMAAVTYTLSASPTSSEGHDIADYLEAFEKACTAPCSPLTRNEVQRRALLALADPLLVYSMYGLAVSYIGNGSTTGPMPLIPVGGGVHLMPSLGTRSHLTAENGAFARPFTRSREPRAESDESPESPCVWETQAPRRHGASAPARRMCCVCGAFVSGWRSMSGGSPSCSPIKHLILSTWGPAHVATVVVPMPQFLRSRWTDGIQISAGYKSQGFVPGEQLSGGGVVRAGIALGK